MFSENSRFLRFWLTYGILFLAIALPAAIFYQPIQKYVDETQQQTALISKSSILGYITPDFKQFAQNILEDHVYTPQELASWPNVHGYLYFYKKGSELLPDLFEMHYMQGICQLWMGDVQSAEDSLRQSLKINSLFFWSYYNLGLLYLKEGKIDAAILVLTQAQRIPTPITLKILHDYQAFFSIWQFMPDPEHYIVDHLQQANRRINYLLLVALAVRSHHADKVYFDPKQWNPIFF